MSDYLDHTIDFYDKRAQKATADARPILEEADTFIGMLKPGSLVLDAGCAQGKYSQYMLDHGLTVHGIDYSAEAIKLAQRTVPGVAFSHMDVRTLQFPSNHFDGIWCNATLLHLTPPDMERSLLEFKRTLKMGGGLVISLMEGQGSHIQQEAGELSRHFTYVTSDDLRDMLTKAGFEVTKLYMINERKRWGTSGRDLNWLYAFAKKP